MLTNHLRDITQSLNSFEDGTVAYHEKLIEEQYDEKEDSDAPEADPESEDSENPKAPSNQDYLHPKIQKFSKNILEGLDFSHSKCKIIHLDMKPENLLLTVDPANITLRNEANINDARLSKGYIFTQRPMKTMKK